MFLTPLSLQNISRLRNPNEKVPLSEHYNYQEAQELIKSGAFQSAQLVKHKQGLFQGHFLWQISDKNCKVEIYEEKLRGPLTFECNACDSAPDHQNPCAHKWASYVLLWQALTLKKEQILHPDIAALHVELMSPDFLGVEDYLSEKIAQYNHVQLDSLSFFSTETQMTDSQALTHFLPVAEVPFDKTEVSKSDELLSPRLWHLPEIFRRKPISLVESSRQETQLQIKICQSVAYNFTNGMQITAMDILRHPLHKKIPAHLLPQGGVTTPIFEKWPLISQAQVYFVSQAQQDLEVIMQRVIANAAQDLNKGQIKIYLQSPHDTSKRWPIHSIDFNADQVMDWRIEFSEKDKLTADFKLVNFRKNDYLFFPSFAIAQEDHSIVIHPWLTESQFIQKALNQAATSPELVQKKSWSQFEIVGEPTCRKLIKTLRSRNLPVKITGGSRILDASQTRSEIHFDENAQFFVQHDAKIVGQKNLIRKGFSDKAQIMLQTLSEGLGFLLKADVKDIASGVRAKREWDLKLLRHLGILQYIAFEGLHLHFEKTLSDGAVVLPEQLFAHLQNQIKILLTVATNTQPQVLTAQQSLTDLCSRSVVSCLEDFTNKIFELISTEETFYSESGEVQIKGLVEREMRLIFELLKSLVLTTQGDIFKRTKTSLMSKISPKQDIFVFPVAEATRLQSSLETLQPLLPHGFQIYYKDQPLQELQEDEFRVDFALNSHYENKQFNWFELNPQFFLRGEEVPAEQFLKLGSGGVIEFNGKLYMVPRQQMPSLRRLEFFWKKLQAQKALKGEKKKGEGEYVLPRHQILELLALRASGIQIRGDHEWQKICQFYDQLGTQQKTLTPEGVLAQLKPYQSQGYQWLLDLYHLKLGALLADDMGLGKTLQTLAFLEHLRESGELGQSLIVVPSSLVYNWLSEAAKFTPQIPLAVFSSKESDKIYQQIETKEPLVLITTYGLLMEHGQNLSQYKWNILVFDEAQNLKNLSTKRTSAARSLQAHFKVCLTGTPMENHYGEFYSLVDLLVPGSLGPLDDFRRQFVNTEIITREEMQDLKLKIKPLLMRRTKKEILDQLPEKQETKISISFEEKQKSIYRDIALSYNQRIKENLIDQGVASVQLQMLTALLRLRQACSDPAALPNVKYDKVPPKLETLMDSLGEIVESGESALVFTQFIQTLEHTTSLLKKAGIAVYNLHGGVPTKQRQKILEDFNNNPNGAVLVMTLKTGGVGLNLTKASYVFHLEPWWNPSVENQATDRAHRLGQKKAVQVFRYIMHESLEEKIEILKTRKDIKFQNLFSQTEKESELGMGTNQISKEDFDFLLGLK